MSDYGLKAIVDENYFLKAENTELRNALGRQMVMLDELVEKANLKQLVHRVTISDWPTENIGLTERERDKYIGERLVSELMFGWGRRNMIQMVQGTGRGEISISFAFLRMP